MLKAVRYELARDVGSRRHELALRGQPFIARNYLTSSHRLMESRNHGLPMGLMISGKPVPSCQTVQNSLARSTIQRTSVLPLDLVINESPTAKCETVRDCIRRGSLAESSATRCQSVVLKMLESCSYSCM